MVTQGDESEDDYLDDPIKLIDYEQGRVLSGNGPYEIKANIDLTDSDVDVISLPPQRIIGTLTSQFFDTARNLEQLKRCRPLSIKIVDCDKHPWYYRKKHKQLEDECEFIIVDDDDEVPIIDKSNNCEKMSINKSPSAGKPKIRPVDIIPYIGTKHNNNFKYNPKPVDKPLDKLKDKPIEKLIDKVNVITNRAIFYNETVKTLPEVDFKKNVGLVGLKIMHVVDMALKSTENNEKKKTSEDENNLPNTYKPKPKSMKDKDILVQEKRNKYNRIDDVYQKIPQTSDNCKFPKETNKKNEAKIVTNKECEISHQHVKDTMNDKQTLSNPVTSQNFIERNNPTKVSIMSTNKMFKDAKEKRNDSKLKDKSVKKRTEHARSEKITVEGNKLISPLKVNPDQSLEIRKQNKTVSEDSKLMVDNKNKNRPNMSNSKPQVPTKQKKEDNCKSKQQPEESKGKGNLNKNMTVKSDSGLIKDCPSFMDLYEESIRKHEIKKAPVLQKRVVKNKDKSKNLSGETINKNQRSTKIADEDKCTTKWPSKEFMINRLNIVETALATALHNNCFRNNSEKASPAVVANNVNSASSMMFVHSPKRQSIVSQSSIQNTSNKPEIQSGSVPSSTSGSANVQDKTVLSSNVKGVANIKGRILIEKEIRESSASGPASIQDKTVLSSNVTNSTIILGKDLRRIQSQKTDYQMKGSDAGCKKNKPIIINKPKIGYQPCTYKVTDGNVLITSIAGQQVHDIKVPAGQLLISNQFRGQPGVSTATVPKKNLDATNTHTNNMAPNMLPRFANNNVIVTSAITNNSNMFVGQPPTYVMNSRYSTDFLRNNPPPSAYVLQTDVLTNPNVIQRQHISSVNAFPTQGRPIQTLVSNRCNPPSIGHDFHPNPMNAVNVSIPTQNRAMSAPQNVPQLPVGHAFRPNPVNAPNVSMPTLPIQNRTMPAPQNISQPSVGHNFRFTPMNSVNAPQNMSQAMNTNNTIMNFNASSFANVPLNSYGYGGFNPNECNPYWTYNMPMVHSYPPPPPPPLPEYNPMPNPPPPATPKVTQGATIIGQNTGGVIRAISITTPSKTKKQAKADKVVPHVNSKKEMFKELNKALQKVVDGPPAPNKSISETVARPCIKRFLDKDRPRPGPLSKKLKQSAASADITSYAPLFTDRNTSTPVNTGQPQSAPTGYSSPILPILTYETTYEFFANQERQGRQSVSEAPKADKEDCTIPKVCDVVGNINTVNSSTNNSVDDKKKISLDEYKKRVTKTDSISVSSLGGDNIKIKTEIKTEYDDGLKTYHRRNSDLDLGYDSDSTVKL